MHNSTPTTIGAFLALAVFCHAQEPKAPQEFLVLKETWSKARKQATDPVDKRYSDALSAMKTRFTKAGQLEGALVVDAELKALTAVAPTPPSTSKGNLKALLPTIEIKGTWAHGDFHVAFTETEATMAPGTKFERRGNYEVTAQRKVKLDFPPAPPYPILKVDIEFNREMTEFTSSRADLKGTVKTNVPK